jgi:hypothetical protein
MLASLSAPGVIQHGAGGQFAAKGLPSLRDARELRGNPVVFSRGRGIDHRLQNCHAFGISDAIAPVERLIGSSNKKAAPEPFRLDSLHQFSSNPFAPGSEEKMHCLRESP